MSEVEKNKTNIHYFTDDITPDLKGYLPKLPDKSKIIISGYSFFGKPTEEERNNWCIIGTKLFVTEIEITNDTDLEDDIYEECIEYIEDYVADSYSVGMRDSQLSKDAKFEKVDEVDFEFDNLEGEEEAIEVLDEKYKNEEWFNKETRILRFEVSYAEYRMYHIITTIDLVDVFYT